MRKSRIRLILRGLGGFVTFMVAVATLVTAIVAYRNEQLLKRQVDFNADETRPFLRLEPRVASEKPFRVYLEEFDVGRVPARVTAYDMLVQVGHEVFPLKGGRIYIPDILYPDQPGGGIFRTLTHEQALPFLKGSEALILGGCVVYGSITGDDSRLWKVSIVYRFDSPTAALPLGLLKNEVAVPPGTNSCDANKLYGRWLSQVKIRPN